VHETRRQYHRVREPRIRYLPFVDNSDRTRPAATARPAPLALIALAVLTGTGLLGGCASSAGGGAWGGSVATLPALPSEFDDVVTADLAAVLEQSFEPRTTTVQIPRRGEDRVTRAVARRLVERGFGVQRVAVDQGPNLLIHTRATTREPTGSRVVARLSVGSFAVRRAYLVDRDGRVSTAGALRVYGAPAILPHASLMHERLRIDDPSHLDIEFVAPHRGAVATR